MPPSLTPQEFVAKWRQVKLKESSAYQQHFIDVCRLVGHPTPSEIDPAGTFFAFQAGAIKTGGEQGFADIWYKDHFAWEYKGKHANLGKVYAQLLQYRESLQNPYLLIVSDLDQMHIHTNFTNTVKRLYPLALDDILKPEGLAILKAAFYNPESLISPETTEAVTKKAAVHFSHLAEILRRWDEQPEEIAHFLIQLLFCLFAEDVELLPHNLFSRLVVSANANSKAFSTQLRQLFSAMSTGGWFGAEEILHFNGHLFENDLVLDLDSEGLGILREVSALDWSNIEPSILGTLFERGLDPSKCSQLGAHYTSKEDILLIVEPVLMAPLRRKWIEIQTQASVLAGSRNVSLFALDTGEHRTTFHAVAGHGETVCNLKTPYFRCRMPLETLKPVAPGSNRNRMVPSGCKVRWSIPPAGQVDVPLAFFSSNTMLLPSILFRTRSIEQKSVALFPQILPTLQPGWMMTFRTAAKSLVSP